MWPSGGKGGDLINPQSFMKTFEHETTKRSLSQNILLTDMNQNMQIRIKITE